MTALYLGASVLTLGVWLVTHVLWIKSLYAANGSRPFIALTVTVAWIMTTMSAVLVATMVVHPPHDGLEQATGYVYMLCALAVCLAMWHLHHELGRLITRLPHE